MTPPLLASASMTAALFFSLVLASLLLGELLMRKWGASLEISRKAFHLSAGTVCILMTHIAMSPVPLAIVGGIFTVSLLVSVRFNLFKIQTRRRGYGTVAFAVGYAVSVLGFWDHKAALIAALAVLTYADALAAIVGVAWGRHPLSAGPAPKSWEGSGVFLAVSFLSVACVLHAYGAAPMPRVLFIAGAAAVLCAALEAVCSGNLDNGVLPVYAAIMIAALLEMGAGSRCAVAWGLVMAALIAGFSYRQGWVTLRGALAAFLILATLFGLGRWKWFSPLLFLLVSSSLLHRLTRGGFKNPFTRREGPRGLTQIAAKGMPSMVLALAYAVTGWDGLYLILLAMVATASSDTWASSIGVASRAKSVVSLPFLDRVPKGMSGGVSPLGTLAAVAGSALAAAFVFLFMRGDARPLFYWVTLSGVFGSTVDSVLGGTLQALYRCKACGRKTELLRHCAGDTVRIRGLAWMNNEAVNLLSGLAGGAIAAILLTT